ncbi:CATRA conflict system CASPASE/TPR repeat-associated protein [Streptomyces sp. NPDC060322]|uniref:CATRA conflict system CASPASE/TPR repeat-associated protein n=1 Tax=Streptomyces sp. NPDC060322 TaxID=3347097 RepID=UPI0036681CEA
MTAPARGTIRKPSLVVMAFAPLDGRGSNSGRAALTCLWEACRRLGMTEEVADLPLVAATGGFDGASRPEPGFRLLSAAHRPDPRSMYEVFSFVDGDVVGLVALLAPNDSTAGPEQWGGMLHSWERAVEAAGPPSGAWGLLGLHLVFEALTEGTADDDLLSGTVRGHAPPGGRGARGWWAGFDRTDEGFSVWREQEGTPETAGRFYVLAPVECEAALDEWAWYAPGEHRLRPLARYLMHLSKIRYQAQAQDRATLLPAWLDESDRRTEALLRELDDVGGRRPLTGVIRTAAQLDKTQRSPQGMLWTITRQRQVSNALAAGLDNLLSCAPSVRRVGPGTSWPDRDRAHAEMMIKRVDDDRLNLEAARERADSVRAQARTMTDRALADERSLLTLIQTSVLGAVLTGLAAVQTLEYKLPLPDPLQSPFIAVLTAVSLTLPVSVLRWTGVALNAYRHRWLDRVAAGLTASSLGWLAITGYGVVWGAGPPSAVWTLPGAAAAAGAAVLAVDRLLRRTLDDTAEGDGSSVARADGTASGDLSAAAPRPGTRGVTS